jgi:hypothetical protein
MRPLLLAAAGAAATALVLLPPPLSLDLASVAAASALLLALVSFVFLPEDALNANITRNSTAAAPRPLRTSGFSSSAASFCWSVLASAAIACACTPASSDTWLLLPVTCCHMPCSWA